MNLQVTQGIDIALIVLDAFFIFFLAWSSICVAKIAAKAIRLSMS